MSPESSSTTPLPEPVVLPVVTDEDDDFADVVLEDRQGPACSMEEGCESCQ